MNDLLNRIALIESVMSQPLSNSEKLTKSFGQFSGLVLSDLPQKIRNKLENAMLRLNHIISKNNIKTSDDYAKMNQKDLKSIIEILSQLCYELKGMIIKELV